MIGAQFKIVVLTPWKMELSCERIDKPYMIFESAGELTDFINHLIFEGEGVFGIDSISFELDVFGFPAVKCVGKEENDER